MEEEFRETGSIESLYYPSWKYSMTLSRNGRIQLDITYFPDTDDEVSETTRWIFHRPKSDDVFEVEKHIIHNGWGGEGTEVQHYEAGIALYDEIHKKAILILNAPHELLNREFEQCSIIINDSNLKKID